MDKNFRLIFSFKENARVNMSIDKALVNSFEQNDKAILRLYTWENCFTVGLSQKCEDYPQFMQKYNNNCAKRITGGGVLFHGTDLSYSLVLPSDSLKNLNVKQSYEKICRFLLNFYKDLGLNANFAKDLSSISLSKNEFCQVGYEAYDIIINGKKIGGNAQKRTKKIIFQHGSIPIKTTKDKIIEGYSLEDLNIFINFKEAKKRLKEAFENTFDVNLEISSLNMKEENSLKNILEENNDY